MKMESTMEAGKLREKRRHRDRVKFNVGGQLFLTRRKTLQNLPGTMLYYLDESDEHYDSDSEEYYFDRSPTIFSAILDYHRTGELHLPNQLCGPFVKKELAYWGIDDNLIQPCCWSKYKDFEESEIILRQVDKAFRKPHMQWCTATYSTSNAFQDIAESAGRGCSQQKCTCNSNNSRRKLWVFLEDPSSSMPARIWGIIDLLLILVSIFITSAESVDYFRVPTSSNVSETAINDSLGNRKHYLYLATDLHPVMLLLEWASNAIFTLELFLRIIACPFRWQFFTSVLNWVDIVCVASVWIIFLLHFIPQASSFKMLTVYKMFLWLRSLRVVRLFRVARHYTGWRILVLALRESRWEIFVLCVFIFTGMLVFSTLIFYVEFWHPEQFHNIPVGFWWSIVTMTTVGYGDIHPVTPAGYLVGSLCALCGMLATGLPIPIIANNFNIFYSYSRVREKLQKRLVRAKQSIIQRSSSLNLSKVSRGAKPKEHPLTGNGHLISAENLEPTAKTDLSLCDENRKSSEEAIRPNGCATTGNGTSTQEVSNEENSEKDEARSDDSKLKINRNVSPKKPNSILKKQLSYSEGSLVLSSIHEENYDTKNVAQPTTGTNQYTPISGSHSFPLLDSNSEAVKSHNHKLLRRISSVSFKLDDDVYS